MRADPAAARTRLLADLGLPEDVLLVLHAPDARDDYDLLGPDTRLDLDRLARLRTR